MGMEEAATRAAWEVLYLLHARTDYSDVPLDVVMDMSKNHRCVKATQLVPPEQLLLAPCALKAKSLSLNSVHASRATIDVVFYRQRDEFPSSVVPKPKTKRRKIAKEDAVAGGSDENVGADSKEAAVAGGSDGQAGILKSFKSYVNPEWKAPEADHDDPESWNWQDDESMHPYWSIRRLSQQRLGEATFNMKTTKLSFNAVTVGAPGGVSTSLSMEVTVPFLTNSVEIPQGLSCCWRRKTGRGKYNRSQRPGKIMSTSAVAEAVEVVDFLLGRRGRLPRL